MSAANLRVIWPPNWPEKTRDPKHSLTRRPTLCEFYETYVLPMIRNPQGRSAGTITQDRVALRHWKRITGDPPLSEITPEVCARFMSTLAADGMAESTRRKTAIHIQFILDLAGPKDRRRRNAAQLLEEVPYLERPNIAPEEPEPAFTLAEIESLLEVTRDCGPTQAIPTVVPLWWASLIRFAWHSGLRRMNLLNIRWSWLLPDGWLVIPPKQYKQQKMGRRFYISKAARAAAERIRTEGEDRIFPWNSTMDYFHERWRKLTKALPSGRQFGTKAIRRATLTWLAERNPLVSRLVAGHRKLDVLEDFYVQREVVIQLLESMPVPKGWDL